MSNDMTMKEKVADLLDEVVYPRLYFLKSFTAYKGEEGKAKRIAGIDAEFHMKDEHLTSCQVSEKGAFYYMNTPLSSFAFELGGIPYGKFQPGWLLNPKKETTHYLLMWLWADEKYTLPDLKSKENKEKRIEQMQKFDVQDIRKLEFILVDKEKMMKYLYACGIEEEELKRFASNMIAEHAKDAEKFPYTISADEYLEMNSKPINEQYRGYLNYNLSFKVNRNKKNRPVTLIVNRIFLERKFAVQRFRLTHEEKSGWNLEILSAYDEEPLLKKYKCKPGDADDIR